MSEVKKHCDTCKYSYGVIERSFWRSKGVKRQHCSNAEFHSARYTHKMLMEDRGKNYCRFWTPKL